MGVYLNSGTARTLYKNETQKPYFIDKSLLLEELFPFVKEGSNYICITRPRRFGKTVMANMIAAFFPTPMIRQTFSANCKSAKEAATKRISTDIQ